MLLECFYRGLDPENRIMANQLSLGCLMRHSYETTTQLLDCVAKTNKEKIEKDKDQDLTILLGQLDVLAQKVKDLEVLSKKKDMYIPPYKRRNMKKQEGGQIEEVLLLILHKVEKHDRVLSEIRENVLLLNQLTSSYSMLIQLLGSQMDEVLNDLYPEPKEGWPYENDANPTNGTEVGSCIMARH